MESWLSYLLWSALIFNLAQSLYVNNGLGLRTILENGDHQRIDNCLENPVEAIGACLKDKGTPISVPYNTTADGTYVFEDNFFLYMCSLVTEANKCYGELESADCEMQVPKFVENLREVISLMCPKKRELSRLIDCMNRRSFQDVVSSAANFDNQQVTMENLCSVADEKLQHGLNSTRSLCGEDNFRLLRDNIRGVIITAEIAQFYIYPTDYCSMNVA